MHHYPLTFGFTRPEQNIAIMELKDLALPDSFKNAPPARLAFVAAGGWGGNHKHERQEAFVAGSPGLYIVWRDKNGMHQEQMTAADGTPQVYLVDAWVPHMVVNKGQQPAVLYEVMSHNDGPATPLEGAESLR